MDPNSFATPTTNAPRKVRFKPKAPPARREHKLVPPKVEKVEEDADARELLRLYDDQIQGLNVRPKAEKKDVPKIPIFGERILPNVKLDPAAAAKNVQEKDYKEPWDYHSYYPVTLPLRMPRSGNPELLDELEFGNGSESQNYDEDSINAAEQLGLTDEDADPRLLFLQLPSKLPMPKEHPGKDTDGKGPASYKSNNRGACSLDELPSGYMGKLVVYKSGVVKLKLGDNLYDVASGVDSTFAQDVVSINTEEKRCSAVGELNKRAIITPDLDSLFDKKLEL